MVKNNITLCLFTSTKSHFDGVVTYRETVESLLAQVPATQFGQLLAHIQVSPGQEDRAGEMRLWLKSKGFEVHETTGEWKHHDQSHHSNYLLSQIKMSKFVNCHYYIHFEDDFKLFSVKYNINDLFLVAQNLLKANRNILEVRFPRFNNEIERLKNIKQKHGIEANIIEGQNQDDLFFLHADNANFHPTIRRARDMYITLKLVEDNLERLSYNCEHGFSQVFKMLSREKSSLACFYPEVAQCLHIGVRTPEERDVSGQVFDR